MKIREIMAKVEQLEKKHHRRGEVKLLEKPDYDCYMYHEGFCTCKSGPYNYAIKDVLSLLEDLISLESHPELIKGEKSE